MAEIRLVEWGQKRGGRIHALEPLSEGRTMNLTWCGLVPGVIGQATYEGSTEDVDCRRCIAAIRAATRSVT